MKKILYSLMGAALLIGVSSCSDFLDQKSPSQLDRDFVFSDPTTARGALQNAYEKWRADGGVHGNGSFYNFVVSSSDIECQPESYAGQSGRWVPSYFYGWTDGTYSKRGTEEYDPFVNGSFESTWTNLYSIVALTNTIIDSYQSNEATFNEMVNQGKATDLSQVYGEAVALRATCYYELVRSFGDCAFQLKSGETATHLTCRHHVPCRREFFYRQDTLQPHLCPRTHRPHLLVGRWLSDMAYRFRLRLLQRTRRQHHLFREGE